MVAEKQLTRGQVCVLKKRARKTVLHTQINMKQITWLYMMGSTFVMIAILIVPEAFWLWVFMISTSAALGEFYIWWLTKKQYQSYVDYFIETGNMPPKEEYHTNWFDN